MGETTSSKLRSLAREAAELLLDLLFPQRCAGCAELGSVWCDACRGEVLPFRPRTCSRCHSMCNEYERLCGACFLATSSPPTRSYGWYQPPLSRALVRLKYKPDPALAGSLAELMAVCLQGSGWQPTLILAVPLHAGRAHQRGFNQAQLLAKALARRLGVRITADGLRRVRATPSQVGLNMSERRANMNLAFAAKGAIVRDESVLIVDDLRTTGATLADCARALKVAGCGRVRAVTVAQAGGAHSH